MSTQIDSTLFVDIADAIGLGNPAIIEKDYYVVKLLELLTTFKAKHHQIVFTGGTALTKAHINTFRMSEDVDFKLIPTESFVQLKSRNLKRQKRKDIKLSIQSLIKESQLFSVMDEPIVMDEYRYICFDIRYPQSHQKAPCLRPFIKLELTETDGLSETQSRTVQSIYSEILNLAPEVKTINCSSLLETQAEKILSMLRRTASVARNSKRADDETLVRHIYDTYQIQKYSPSNIELLSQLFKKVLVQDVKRYGNQHPQLINSPVDELRYGLKQLSTETKFATRFDNYVNPMVYAKEQVSWDTAFTSFYDVAEQVLNYIQRED